MTEQTEKVCKGLKELRNFADTDVHPVVSPDNWGVYSDLCDLIDNLTSDALALIRQQQERIKAQDEVIRALRKVGYPHNFQREPTWIVNYMYAITDVIKKAVKLE